MDHITWRSRDLTTSAEPGTTDSSEALETPAFINLMDIPVSSSSNYHSPALQPPLDYESQPDSMTTHFLSPDGYTRRDSAVSDSVGSVYAWSDASPPSSSADTPAGKTSPFLHPYYLAGSSHQHPTPALAAMAGFTPPSMDQLILDSEPAGRLYPSSTSYPTLSFPADDQWFPLPAFARPSTSPSPGITTTPVPAPDGYLSPSPPAIHPTSSRDVSASPTPTFSSDMDISSSSRRQVSPSSTSSTNNNNPADLSRYGIPTADGAWRCAHPGCSSHAVFRRGCDLRKHFNRHRKYLFCRHEGCPQSTHGGFSSKKDRTRHEAKHNPGIVCEWTGCGRVFSRVDNMKDHVRRIHRKGEQ